MSFKNITWQQVAVLTVCITAMGLSYRFLGINAVYVTAVVTSIVTFLLGRGDDGGDDFKFPRPPAVPTLGAALVTLLLGCGATQAAQQDSARGSYATDIELCFKDAGSRAGVDECRKNVDRRYGIDAGFEGAK